MEKRDRVVEVLVMLVNQYHQLREHEGIGTPATEWARAEISGARAFLEATLADRERGALYAQVQIRTGKGLPSRNCLTNRCLLSDVGEPRGLRLRERWSPAKNR
jgi:hypothetical protein